VSNRTTGSDSSIGKKWRSGYGNKKNYNSWELRIVGLKSRREDITVAITLFSFLYLPKFISVSNRILG
jgi:hypothetical protein